MKNPADAKGAQQPLQFHDRNRVRPDVGLTPFYVTPFGEAPWAFSNFWMYSVLLDPEAYGDVRALVRAGAGAGIGLRPLWHPLHRQPAFAGCGAYRIEVAERLYARGVSLPCSVGITAAERERVVAFVADARR